MATASAILNHQFVKFLLVGVLNTLFGYSVFALLVFWGVHYILAVFISTVLGVLFNFQTFGKLVFKYSGNSRLIRFVTSYVILYLINIFLIKYFLLFIHNIYISGALATIIAAILSYLLNSKWVFASAKRSVL